jgi:hypothetical protein
MQCKKENNRVKKKTTTRKGEQQCEKEKSNMKRKTTT